MHLLVEYGEKGRREIRKSYKTSKSTSGILNIFKPKYLEIFKPEYLVYSIHHLENCIKKTVEGVDV